MPRVRELKSGRFGAPETTGRDSRLLASTGEVFRRFAKFTIVGASGIVVQTAMLALLLRVAGLHYLVATAFAVEISVLNNFMWHSRWTWADRPAARTAHRLLRFNVTTGMMSLAGNLLIMFLLVGGLQANPQAANLITIGICSTVNFFLADRVVFIGKLDSVRLFGRFRSCRSSR